MERLKQAEEAMKANFGLSGGCSSSPCPQRGWGLCCADFWWTSLDFLKLEDGPKKKMPTEMEGVLSHFQSCGTTPGFLFATRFHPNHTGKRHPCLTLYTYAQYIYVSLSLWSAHIIFTMLTEDIKSSCLHYTTSSPNAVCWKVAAFAVEVLRGQVRLGWAMPEAVGRPGRRWVAVFFLVRCTSQFTIHLGVGDE